MWLCRFSREKQLQLSVGCVLITACFTYLGSFGVNAAARESGGISGSISCVQLLFCGGGTEIILSVPLAPRLPAQEQATHSQILSLSLSSHLGNGNLYLQTVGAGGEHEILKSTSRCSPPPSPLGLPPLSLPTPPPLPLFISEMHCKPLTVVEPPPAFAVSWFVAVLTSH